MSAPSHTPTQPKPLRCVGLTGTCGSGKTQVSQRFASLGVPVIDADVIARQLTQPGTVHHQQIIAKLGPSAHHSDHTLNRRTLRQRMLDDPSFKAWLESHLHPAIREEMARFCTQVRTGYCLAVIPLLNNDNHALFSYLQRICLVQADRATQIKRIAQRDQITDAEAAALLELQANLHTQHTLADDLIKNHSSIDDLHAQVDALHKRYTAMSKHSDTRQ